MAWVCSLKDDDDDDGVLRVALDLEVSGKRKQR